MGEWEVIESEQVQALVPSQRAADAIDHLSRKDRRELERGAGRKTAEAHIQAYLTQEIQILVAKVRAESVGIYRQALTLMMQEVTRAYPTSFTEDQVLDVHRFTNRYAVGQAKALAGDFERINDSFAADMSRIRHLVVEYPEQRSFIAGLLQTFSRR